MKKIIFFLSSFLLIISTVCASTQRIYVGEKIPEMYIRKIDESGKVTNKQGGFLRRVSDDAFVYCLEPFIALIDGYEYVEYQENFLEELDISAEVWEDISLIAYYGYMYPGHTEDYWYYITQMLIWMRVAPDAQFYFTDTLGGPINEAKYQEEIQEIKYLVYKHKTLPNIDDVTLLYGDRITIQDSNEVLNNYEVTSDNKLANISGNNIEINGSKLGSYNIKLVRESNNYDNVPIVYIDEDSQKVMAVGNVQDKVYEFNINVIPCNIKIIKYQETLGKEYLLAEGIEFGLYDLDNNLLETKKTNESGEIIFSNLKIGEYKIRELTVRDEYISIEEIPVSVSNERSEVEIKLTNELKKGKVKVIKYKELEDKEIVLAKGVEIGLFDKDKNLIDVGITNEFGEVVFDNLVCGKYYVRELSEFVEYELDDTYYKVIVKENSEEVIDIVNYLKKGSLIINKIGDDYAHLEGVEFNIYNHDDELVFSGATNSKGILEVNDLLLGSYYIVETKASFGYQILNDKIYFNIVEDDEVINVSITNERIRVKVPDTGMYLEEIILFIDKKRLKLA